MKRVVLFMTIMVIAISVIAKPDKITGVIKDRTTNRNLKNCAIVLYKSDQVYDTKFTDKKGEFAFYRLDTGSYTLKVEMNDYASEEYEVDILTQENINHSFRIYLRPTNVVPAIALEREYPGRSEMEYFATDYLYKEYQTDTTLVFTSIGECSWNEDHEMLYVGVLYLDAKGEADLDMKHKLLGTFEVVPPSKEEKQAVAHKPKEENKWLSVMEKLGKVAGNVMKDYPIEIIKK